MPKQISSKLRIERARMHGTYMEMKPELEQLLLVERLTHQEVADKLGITKSTLHVMCLVLNITVRNTRDDPTKRTKASYTDLAAREQLTYERRLTSTIRSFASTWDRGW